VLKEEDVRLRKMLKSERGISPILATLLLIVIAVAAIIVTYAWITTYMSSTTGQAGILLKKDAVNWNSTHIIIYVRNTGTADATIDAVYIGTSSTNLELQTSVTYNPSSKVVVKDGGTITITVTYSWTSGTWYYFKIVPKVGEPLTFQEKAP
jgi:flagellin-like protein